MTKDKGLDTYNNILKIIEDMEQKDKKLESKLNNIDLSKEASELHKALDNLEIATKLCYHHCQDKNLITNFCEKPPKEFTYVTFIQSCKYQKLEKGNIVCGCEEINK